ncbi:MAG: 60S ribosomal export protein NMD3 [Candidatus Natronoplasma sp.]
MLCVECGAEVPELHDGMCIDCYVDKKVSVEVEDPIEIEICSKCGSVRKGDKWLERPDFETVMLDRIEDSLSISSSVEKFSFQVEFDESDPKNIEADLIVELTTKGVEKKKHLSTHIVLKKGQCKNCSKKEGDYYEAILQVRPTEEEMTEEQKSEVSSMVHKRIKVDRGKEKKVFITLEREIHGGLDFYLSDRRVTRNLSYDIADLLGGDVKETSELAGRKDGQNVYRMTYSVRLPPYEKGDFIEFEDKIYRIRKTKRGSGPIVVHDLEENKDTTISKENMNDAIIYGGEELVEKAVVVSEEKKEIQIMDPETYETMTLLKLEGFTGNKDEVEVVRIKQRLHLLPENPD